MGLFLTGLLLVGLIMGGMMGGVTNYPSDNQSSMPVIAASTSCCDSGDGDSCQVDSTDCFTFNGNGKKYCRLKSDIALLERFGWIVDSGDTYDGKPIFLNDSQRANECGGGVDDQMWHEGRCVALPDDQVIYVCKQECDQVGKRDPNSNVLVDAYFIEGDPIPDFIKNCSKDSTRVGPITTPKIEVLFPQVKKETLQLKTFTVSYASNAIPWLSPYCKPAIYLYPEKETQVAVKVKPKGKMTFTIPSYPPGGWKVTAFPNGQIFYQDSVYPYLYYEAEVFNEAIGEISTGFVSAYENLSSLFDRLLPQLGLNYSEKQEFSQYWLKILPESPYYFVGFVPSSFLDKIAPLDINPKPDIVIRVTLLFKPIDKKIDVSPPVISSVKRKGFTVVEWGGLFDTKKNPGFTCLM